MGNRRAAEMKRYDAAGAVELNQSNFLFGEQPWINLFQVEPLQED
ncbi:hypothetical protein [Arenimonas sp.]